ncbi:post-transcriptional regulator [Brevibacillus sp. H7]|uniref:post-transcriptional regulator n=1 Tax=Brevibacillus sp. H7 TaxID=3349138 RepID=UPI0037FA45B1
MDERHKQELFEEVRSLCESKAEEFAMLGYDNVKAEDVWECVSSAYKQVPAMHQLVNDILSLKVTKYMNWLMIQMYKNS